jgi:hypothetical protein
MIFDKLNTYYKEKIERQSELREQMFDIVKSSNEFLFKILGKTNSEEYWEWRLDFDCKRYNIKL